MKPRTLPLAVLLVCALAVSSFAVQSSSDPLTGTWTGDWGPTATHRNPVTVELKWDGKALTGNVNPGPNAIPVQRATYDAASGAVRLEAEATGRQGLVRFVVDGKIANGAMTGSWSHDATKGDFKITKK